MYISKLFNNITPSGTVAFTSLIQALREEGRDVIDLAVGEPEFAVDRPIVDATCQALQKGQTRYGPVSGLPALRERLAAKFGGCGSQNIIITNGAKQGLYEIFQVICGEGREVILPTPCWVSFNHQIRMSGGVPVSVPTLENQLDIQRIADAINDRTAAILINSPNNPTGAVYDRAAIADIVELCLRNDLWLISDEAYADFVYGNNPAISPFVFPAIRPQLLIVRSFSKTYAMTGFRIGYVVAPEEIVQRLSTLQGHMTGNVCTFAQYGALCATEISRETREQRRLGYEKRRDCAVSLCRDLFDVIEPGGAFYLFPSLERYSARYGDDREFSRYVLKEANVAVVPGTFFGAPGHIRLSFATSTERLTQGFARLKEVL